MKGLRVFLTLGFMFVGGLSASAQTTLYVNSTTGNDAVLKANNSLSTPWRTIGRAAWGSTNRSTPNASQAAVAGDTVVVAGGTYTTSVAVNNRWEVVYNPANSGTANSPITFTCVGQCVLGAQSANGPVIGANGRNHIRWIADSGRGNWWQISAYGRQSGSATTTQVNTAPDTGPVVCHGATGCWIEGANIDGGLAVDYEDNWNGIRAENCTSCVFRNNLIRNFRTAGNSSNATAITLYGTPDAIIENNHATNVYSGIYFKDQQHTYLMQGVRARFNVFDGVTRCFGWSMTNEGRNYVYQNVCMNSMFGLFTTGGGLSGDWILNNTFYNVTNAALYPTALGSGGRFWNNIVVNAARVIMVEGATMPHESVIDLEHNVYSGFSQFYSGPDGSRTFASFRSAYPYHDGAAPGSVSGNPLFVDPANGDFRICTGVGAPAPICTGASAALGRGVDILDLDGDGSTTDTIPAGAHLTNNELLGIGIRSSTSPSPPTALRIIREP